jgi:hypothetical protein
MASVGSTQLLARSRGIGRPMRSCHGGFEKPRTQSATGVFEPQDLVRPLPAEAGGGDGCDSAGSFPGVSAPPLQLANSEPHRLTRYVHGSCGCDTVNGITGIRRAFQQAQPCACQPADASSAFRDAVIRLAAWDLGNDFSVGGAGRAAQGAGRSAVRARAYLGPLLTSACQNSGSRRNTQSSDLKVVKVGR